MPDRRGRESKRDEAGDRAGGVVRDAEARGKRNRKYMEIQKMLLATNLCALHSPFKIARR